MEEVRLLRVFGHLECSFILYDVLYVEVLVVTVRFLFRGGVIYIYRLPVRIDIPNGLLKGELLFYNSILCALILFLLLYLAAYFFIEIY